MNCFVCKEESGTPICERCAAPGVYRFWRRPNQPTVEEDLMLYGNAYTTADGERLDPRRVWVTPGGLLLYHHVDGPRSRVYQKSEVEHKQTRKVEPENGKI
jgi:hypothetical protein